LISEKQLTDFTVRMVFQNHLTSISPC